MGRPRTKSDAAILAAVTNVVGRLGPARLTVAAVAREVGLAPATVLQRFGSKRGLLLALAVAASKHTEAVFRSAREQPEPRLKVLRQALVELANDIGRPEEFANHLAFLQLDLSDPEFHALLVESHTAGRVAVRGLLADALAAGELTHSDLPSLADALLATWNGALITWAVVQEGPLEGWLLRQLDSLLDPHTTHDDL